MPCRCLWVCGCPSPAGVPALKGPLFVGTWSLWVPGFRVGSPCVLTATRGQQRGAVPRASWSLALPGRPGLCAGKAAGSQRRPSGVTLGQQRSLGSDPGPATNSRTTRPAWPSSVHPVLCCGPWVSSNAEIRGEAQREAYPTQLQTWGEGGGGEGSWHPVEAPSLTPAPGRLQSPDGEIEA